jgi:hypothetical protein
VGSLAKKSEHRHQVGGIFLSPTKQYSHDVSLYGETRVYEILAISEIT